MNVNFRRYAEICKVEPQEDGTIKVYGYASSGAVDSDGETITPEAMKAALPDYMKFGAVREMHQPMAAGTALEAAVEDDGRTSFGAHIVDPIAIKKVTAGVYKGFSVGGKVLSRDPDDRKQITGIKLIEVSLVDRPANPEALISMYKAEDAEEKPVDPPAEPNAAENAAKVAAADKAAIEELAVMLNKRELTPAEFVDAVKAEIARRAAPAPAAPAKLVPAEVRKGMLDLGTFASILASIGWLTQGAEGEAAWEGDNSPLPAELRDWLTQGVRIFNEMAAEETSELLAALQPQVEVITAAAKAAEIAKAGAKFSQATKDALDDVHKCMKDALDHHENAKKCMKDACDKLAATGYAAGDSKEGEDKQDDDASMAAKPGDALKAAVSAPVVPPAAPDASAELLKAELSAQRELIAQLIKQVKHLEDQPAPAKGVIKAVAVGKTEDGAGDEAPGMKPVLKADGTVDEPATLAKVIHRQGPGALWPRTNP